LTVIFEQTGEKGSEVVKEGLRERSAEGRKERIPIGPEGAEIEVSFWSILLVEMLPNKTARFVRSVTDVTKSRSNQRGK